jgi:hypothetical protein
MATSPTITTKPYVVPEHDVMAEAAPRSGWVIFAAVMFFIGAFANFFWGLAALDGRSYLAEGGLLYSTLETWGWIALGWSAVLLIGAILLAARVHIAPVIGVVLATISIVFWLFALPVMPLYAMTVIVLDAFVIYGLLMYSMER